jgi:dipeptidase E
VVLMRLYLSSFRMGDHPEHLAALVGPANRRAVVIANAMDDAPQEIRRSGVERELTALADLGFDAAELDLREYFDAEQRLRRDLAEVGLAWLRGGNVFMLRHALHRSGGDTVFRDLLARDALVYAGYSAGPCVLSPSLRGLEAVDDADAVSRIYGSEPVWDGLALLGEAFVPHYQSPGHPETSAIDLVVARYQAEGTAYRTLRDGQAIVISGTDTTIV